MAHPAELIVPSARLTMSYADSLLKDVTTSMFGRKPDGVDTNTPAWVFGHLAIYPEDVMRMLGIQGAEEDEAWKSMFHFHTECKDDPSGTIYPPMDEIVDRYRARHNVLLEAMAGVDESVYFGENPVEPMRKSFPMCGQFVNFLLTSHAMMHLGQISAWRRCMGLGACM